MDKQQAFKALVSTLNDRTQNAEVRAGAARGLGHIGGPDACAELAKAVNDRTQNAEVRTAAAEALGRAAG
ncbi:HEAT repeat domain-containing protein [Pseudomonas sp. HTZ2]|uniref:HEAT repeat domain-containing protein n=1 Tax=Pseudomonas sp. HTZ2 TaxID=3075220 RepID=UPI003FA3D60D